MVLQVWLPVGSLAVDWVGQRSRALVLCAQAAGLLIPVCTHLRFQEWVSRPLIRGTPTQGFRCGHPGC